MPVRLCAEPGCPVRVLDASYCPVHKPDWARRRNTSDPHRLYAWQQARRRARWRDRDRCVACGSTRELSVHHIDGDPSNNALANCVTLCRQHHREADAGRLAL